MKRKILLFIILISSLINISSSTLIAQSDFIDEYIYLTEGEFHETYIYPDDYVYEIVLSMDDYSSFKGLSLSARANLHASPDNSGCNITVRLYNGDTGVWVDEYVSAYSPTTWTEWVEVDVDIDVSEIYMDVSYTGDASCAAYTELEIRAQGDIPATEENAAQIDFWADDDYLTLGECTYLNWEVDYATDVYFQGDYR